MRVSPVQVREVPLLVAGAARRSPDCARSVAAVAEFGEPEIHATRTHPFGHPTLEGEALLQRLDQRGLAHQSKAREQPPARLLETAHAAAQ